MKRDFLKAVGATAALTLLPSMTRAHTWAPTQPIRVIIPYGAGGTADIMVRVLVEGARQRLGQPFVLDNRAGAATQIGTGAVVNAKPDGHTLLLVSNTVTINPSLFAKLPYDTLKDLEPITYAGVTPHTLVVNNDLPVHSLKELIAYAKARPGQLSYGSVGNGTSFHLGMEELKKRSGLYMVHVPYRGMSAVLTDVMGNSVQLAFANTPSAAPLVKSGKLRAIAVAHPKRVAQLPDVMTIAEQGYPDFASNSTFIFFAPRATTPEILDRLNDQIVSMLHEPAIRDTLTERGIEVFGTNRVEAANFIRSEIKKYAELVKFSGAKVD
ncbi:tripartite tricarboxylate transporter substrate binding protein [Acidovorax sp. SUPP2522]|uniref:Bug family tripartite tricarboxylate transporter substrate binding protein n=1 Tax=unclassified Acidovorax TaxID=2684926 RepID=UPI00234A8689|nr:MULTISPECIES: tripartite tricarboxylate transporter substrate binding protein [unclassified Acidovorax]WCM99627.1 tripartite tricarboxylate transporter substrate binding protein [Acidovorax sp. GBBC 1281]GKT19079.1 tripartite tricarboxylate transporter substrate binding protein [Acidovorax sp. SUPP2522]